ncbi:MAG: hypothetical protein IH608_09090 [Proteobacteria bacterium]|nr:hypothetical protein [Pseudomonadota bacterium]
MRRDDTLLMCNLGPPGRCNLAAALVAHSSVNKAGLPLLDDRRINAVIIMVLATPVLGPIVTRRVGLRVRAHRA